MRMDGFDLVNDEAELIIAPYFKMTIEENHEMKTLQRTSSTMAFPFMAETAHLKGHSVLPTVEAISLSRAINIKASRKLAYLTLPNRN